MAAHNALVISGELASREALRHTPAGVPALEFTLRHASQQVEAGRPRRVECELPVVALGEAAPLIAAAPLGTRLTATGFLAARSQRRPQPVMHLTGFAFTEGNDNGIQTEETAQQA